MPEIKKPTAEEIAASVKLRAENRVKAEAKREEKVAKAAVDRAARDALRPASPYELILADGKVETFATREEARAARPKAPAGYAIAAKLPMRGKLSTLVVERRERKR